MLAEHPFRNGALGITLYLKGYNAADFPTAGHCLRAEAMTPHFTPSLEPNYPNVRFRAMSRGPLTNRLGHSPCTKRPGLLSEGRADDRRRAQANGRY